MQLIGWDRSDDSFMSGQWFSERIYERRCDLSPSGNLLVYFAAKHHGPVPFDINGTVISHPPFLTELARWPKGDAWGGGGLFEDETTLCGGWHAQWKREAVDPIALPGFCQGQYLGRRVLRERSVSALPANHARSHG